MREPRGIRNHNPGNIRHSPTYWMGQIDEKTDKDFVTFESAKYGIRAIYKILLTYQQKYKLDTVNKIIDRWAPPIENDTAAYVIAVAKACNVDADVPINLRDRKLALNLVKAIIKHENGKQPYPDELISQAIELAL